MLLGVHQGSPPSVIWADRKGWGSADAREPRRMRPHLSPSRTCRLPAGGPHPAACTIIAAGWLICLLRSVEPSPRSQDVTGGGAQPMRIQRLPSMSGPCESQVHPSLRRRTASSAALSGPRETGHLGGSANLLRRANRNSTTTTIACADGRALPLPAWAFESLVSRGGGRAGRARPPAVGSMPSDSED
jgi:hypothetical protein